MGDGHAVRVRSLGRHTIIGEMGLISGRPRSATIQTGTASVLYELSAGRFDELKREQPALGQALLSLCNRGDGRMAEFRQPRDRRVAAVRRPLACLAAVIAP
jgi:CRP-like cAMP-binding protein